MNTQYVPDDVALAKTLDRLDLIANEQRQLPARQHPHVGAPSTRLPETRARADQLRARAAQRAAGNGHERARRRRLKLNPLSPAVTKQLRWLCPNNRHPSKLGPSRPRRDDVRRYCLVCSEETGRLVERVAPRLEAKRQESRSRSVDKGKRRALARRRAATQVDLAESFVNTPGPDFASSILPWTAPKRLLFEVRPSTKPRRPHRDEVNKKIVVIYDHGGDEFDARAQVIDAALKLYYKVNAARYRVNIEKYLHVRPRLDDFEHAWQEVAQLLRAKAAVDVLGTTSRVVGTVSGRMSSTTTPFLWQIPRQTHAP